MNSIKWFRARFPEDLYPPSFENSKEYTERVLSGYELASKSKLSVGGLCRDISHILPSTLARLEELSKYFKNTDFYFIENDSVDNTAELLMDWRMGGTVICKTLGMPRHGSVRTQGRIEDMAMLRNNLQDVIKNNTEADYVIIIDMDLEGFSYDGILSSLTYQFDAMASNGLIYEDFQGEMRRMYYDSYGSKFCPEKTEEELNQLILHRGEKPIRVDSGFGGLCLYETNAYLNSRYSVGDWLKYCEHIPFHYNMDCYINPSQITLYSKTRYSI